MTQTTAPRALWRLSVCFASGGGLLACITTCERFVHHGHAYAGASSMLAHASGALAVGILVGTIAGLVLGLVKLGLDRARLALPAACSLAMSASVCAAVLWVIGPSRYGQHLPRVPLALGSAAAGALLGYAIGRLVQPFASRLLRARHALLVIACVIVLFDLHAYARSYGNVHVLASLTALLLLGAWIDLGVFRPRARTLGVVLLLSSAAFVFLPKGQAARQALLQQGALEKLVLLHVIGPLADRDGDGFARGVLPVDCNDGDPSRHPLAPPYQTAALDCVPLPELARPAPPPVTLRAPRRSLLFVLVDTWRADLPVQLPAWARGWVRYTGYRSCGSRTEQVLSQLLGTEGCPSSLPKGSLPGALAAAGYRLAHFGQYPDWVHAFPSSHKAQSREELVALARDFLRGASKDKPYFAFVHFKGGHAPYDGDGASERERYDTAVMATLAAVQELLPHAGKDTVVVVAGDHGEEFGEHDAGTHALSLYEEVLRTPVWMRIPGRRGTDEPAALDCGGLITLTRAALSDDAIAPPAPTGFSVVASPRGVHGGLSATLMFSTLSADGLKLIYQPMHGLLELYDLRSDPSEQHNLADSRPEAAASLLAALANQIELCGSRYLPADPSAR